jgi:thermolysin
VGLPAGVVLGGRNWYNLAGALDVVAHEIAHAVTDFTSDLIYLNESGALNEAFSDIIGASVEWRSQPPGTSVGQADWLIGEDIARPRGFRSMSDPWSYGAPDHYSLRFTGSSDNGGVHTNSSIVNHMYYLAVIGGTHRLGGAVVGGVGFANAERAERVVFRAFTALLPSSATFAMARAATIQAARDLFGAGSAEEAAFTQAWTAVGVE